MRPPAQTGRVELVRPRREQRDVLEPVPGLDLHPADDLVDDGHRVAPWAAALAGVAVAAEPHRVVREQARISEQGAARDLAWREVSEARGRAPRGADAALQAGEQARGVMLHARVAQDAGEQPGVLAGRRGEGVGRQRRVRVRGLVAAGAGKGTILPVRGGNGRHDLLGLRGPVQLRPLGKADHTGTLGAAATALPSATATLTRSRAPMRSSSGSRFCECASTPQTLSGSAPSARASNCCTWRWTKG